MGSGIWLRLLLALGAFWGLGALESVLGILGKPTLLRIPRELQERTRESGQAEWKKILQGQQKKKILGRLSGGNVTEFEAGRVRFHLRDFSLEILNTTREDARLYEFSLSLGHEEEIWQVQLEVLEAVAHPDIHVLHQEFSNGSCSLALLCSSERGDEVSYSWGSREENGTGSGLCWGSGAVLNLSFPFPIPIPFPAPECVCTAQNRVSFRQAAFDTARCGQQSQGVPGVRTELLVPLVALGLIIIVIIVIITVRATCGAKGVREPSQDTPDSAGTTIYAQVQKPPGAVPKATPAVSCATIYAAATAPPQSPRGRPLPSQEPTTVYASVTLPVG